MKHLLLKASILALSVNLVACSTNTQSENTGVGAVTGAVVGGLAGSLIGGGTGKVVAVGAGAILGAVVGGMIGHSAESSDHSQTYSALNDYNSNQPTTWTNKKTGVTYTVTPTSGRITVHGNPNCRRFVAQATENGHTKRTRGIACRQSNGAWVTVR